MTVIYILTFFFAKLKLIQTRSKVMNAGLREDMGQIRKDRMSQRKLIEKRIIPVCFIYILIMQRF